MRAVTVRLAAVFVAALTGLPSALGDIPPPSFQPPKPRASGTRTVPLAITADPQAEHTRLQIPARFLEQRKARAGRRASLDTIRTVVGGLALSLGVFGLVFVRRGSRAVRVTAAVMIGMAVLTGMASMVWADLAPFNTRAEDELPPGEEGLPPLAIDVPGLPLPQGGPVTLDVVLEIVPQGNEITLIFAAPPAGFGDPNGFLSPPPPGAAQPPEGASP